MNPISRLFHALPFSFGSTAKSTPSPGAAALRPPADLRGAHVGLWSASLKQADAIRSGLDQALQQLPPGSTTQRLAGSAAPDRPLPAATRLEVSDKAAATTPDQLHASWLSRDSAPGGRSLAMASPRVKDSIAWAAACAEHQVAVVVDLGLPEEARQLNHCMRSTAPTAFKDHTVTFKGKGVGGGHVEEKKETALGPEARSRAVSMVMQPHRFDAKGRPFAADPWEDATRREAGAIAQDLAWLRIPCAYDRAISPGALLAACRHLRGQDLAGNRTVAFMSPDGDRRSAVYGAAWEIQRHIDRGGRSRSELADLVETVCMQVRMQRDPEAFSRKEDVASLLAFASLALEERGRA
ncbi:hypothetical protein [Mitsuaria sp. GD03876]|uniref:hypothetical protein n=1 Tax=Mitsuaria sp. GD03876 TaxID=2975399 RepID=UPI00244D2A2D|nr:hypothetical protein [Mitsuaria sp. GD03876]MDH0864284.1 hypothetical protein [Mitsuaria sp. GD03876]